MVWASAVPDDTAAEGATNAATFVISRNGDTSARLAIKLVVSGSSVVGTDYHLSTNRQVVIWSTPIEGPSTATVSFAPGQSSITFTMIAEADF